MLRPDLFDGTDAASLEHAASLDHLVAQSEHDAKAKPGKRSPTRKVRVLAPCDVSLAAPSMLVRGWIPRSAVTVLAGQPGAGKGIAVADIVARGSRGDVMPNGDVIARPFKTLIVCGPGEDGAADWKLRLVAARANLQRCWLVESTVDELGYESPICADDLTAILDHAAADGIDLVVIDSLGAVAGDLDVNKTEIRAQMMNPLANQAKALGLAVLLVHHVRKSGGDALTVVSGSTQIVAAARAVLVVALESDTDARFMVSSKLNGARKSDPVAFTTAGRSILDEHGNSLRDDRDDLVFVPVIAWSDRAVSFAEASAAMAGLPAHRDDAADTLRDVLANGPLRSIAVEGEMSEAGYTRDQAKRARTRIGSATIKVGDHWWTLPPGTPKAEGRTLVEAVQP